MGKQKSRQRHFTLEDYNNPTDPVIPVVFPPLTRSPIPGLVRAGLALVQVVLLARVGCLVLHVQETTPTPWLTWLFAASDQLVEPLRWLVETLNPLWCACIPLLPNVEFVVAVLAYGLLSWLLVSLLGALLNH